MCRSYEAVCFMLPALSQITTELDGCKALVFCGGHKQVSSMLATNFTFSFILPAQLLPLVLICAKIILSLTLGCKILAFGRIWFQNWQLYNLAMNLYCY